ncbi:DNA-directed RNA polymerase III subunit RPC1 [Fusarium sp. NRRL 52700]|nr:DNA-directed RNA polymerase III subunit RPC1 [Fusarium sp. NRRL 52700]
MAIAASVDSPVKQQLVDKLPKRFKGIKFGIQSNQDIANQAVLEVSDRLLYDIENNRAPYRHGPLDSRLGTSSKQGRCSTCQESLKDCNGHFGHVRLPLPAFHVGYLRFIMSILQEICKDCGRVLLEEPERQQFLKELRRPFLDNLRRTQICKKINEQCRKIKTCPYCGSLNGQIRKIGVLKLAHDKFVAYNKSTAVKKVPPESKIKFDNSFNEAKRENPELDKHLRKAMEDLNPLRVLNLFKMISPTDCELLGLDPAEGRPEMFIWQFLPAPPVCIRPSVAQDNASNEDDITTKLADIVWVSGMIRSALQKGSPVQTIMEQWEYLQTQIAMYVNSDVPGLQQPGFGKATRGFCQRLKGKQGRFRGNLSGKRVDFSGRTVISPDPNLGIDQVAVPQLVAKNLTYPERVQRHNLEKLRQCVKNGPDVWPGAQRVIKSDEGGYLQSLKFGNREYIARDLKFGDIVERHLEDNDIVLFNRQPSLHKLSIMSHLAKVRPWRTFRLNECVCGPYNADFDGDEMNLHVPQTEEARAEAINLMGIKHNLATPKNGEPVIAATQDFITAAFLLSSKDRFFDRKTFTYLCMHMMDGKTHLDMPPPAIIAPQSLWTGKQLFSMLMRPNKDSPVKVNLDAKCRAYKARPGQSPDMDPNDGWLVVRNSEVMCGRMDKSTVGTGKKDSIFYVILRDFGPDEAVIAMNRLAKLCARQLTNRGFSIGVGDVFPTESLNKEKEKLVAVAYKQCDDLIETFKAGKLEKAAGCNQEQTLENSMSGILSKVRQQAGSYCVDTLSRNNAPLIMAKSGSKGSDINVAQMVALVGQQIIGGSRVADGFQDRTLPHFHKNARQPPSKGFVKNSFYTGLFPTEFIFHAMSGREGLVDTAVKTAETGYMSRRLMKSLEDLSTQYDDTVRTSGGGIVQFQFGADKLDPVDMEGSAEPVHFQRTWTHAESLTVDNSETSMTPEDIRSFCDRALETERRRYVRRGLLHNEILDYGDTSDYGIDEHEGARGFLKAIERHVEGLASKLETVRKLAGFKDGAMVRSTAQDHADRTAKVTLSTLRLFIKMCLEKYKKAHVEPGHAVGAVGAHSIGEPGTQMTLKTFHFAGVAGMSITQGVPRIKEIINASKAISTPVITCPLENNEQIEAARVVKGRIEKTYISDVLRFVEDEWRTTEGNVVLQIDSAALSDMHLGIGPYDIAEAICKQRKLKVQRDDLSIDGERIIVRVRDVTDPATKRTTARSKATAAETGDMLLRANFLRRSLPNVPISGYPEATRAIIQTSEQSTHTVLVEGYGLRECMTTEGVIGTKARTNNVMECRDVLGIEAARTTIADEIGEVMGDMGIDPRHMQLLADVMTYKGEVLGITRFGLSKMRDSVLQLASFEKTPDHLFEAAAGMKTDQIEGVSECIIMGQTMSVGTGAFQVVRRLGIREGDIKQKPTLFEDAWTEETALKRKARRKIASEFAKHDWQRPSQIRQMLEDDGLEIDDAPEDTGIGAPRSSYNFAPGYHGVVYCASTSDHDTTRKDEQGEKQNDATQDPKVRKDHIKYKLQSMKWGLVPSWTRRKPDYGSMLKTINCRDDSLSSPGGLWASMKTQKRCIVIAQGFYEWLKHGKERLPYYVTRKDGHLMCFAGLWDRVQFEGTGESLYSYTIITTGTNSQLQFLHDRMPVIFDPNSSSMATWLDTSRKQWSDRLQGLLKPFEGDLDIYRVSQGINKVGNDSPTFIVPLDSKSNKSNIMHFFKNDHQGNQKSL